MAASGSTSANLACNTLACQTAFVGGDLTVLGSLGLKSRVVPVTASATVINLLAGDSGTTYVLSQTATTQTINLPAPSVAGVGTYYKFVNVAAAAGLINIVSQNAAGAAIALQAGTQSLVGATPVSGATPTATSTFANGSLIGDNLTLECVIASDAVASPSWAYAACSNAAGGITFA